MRMSLAGGILDLKFAGVAGSPGVIPTLTLKCELTATGFHPGAAAVLFGRVVGKFPALNLPVGETRPLPQVLGYPRSNSQDDRAVVPSVSSIELNLPLDPAAIMRWEDVRKGEEFDLRLAVTVLLTSHGRPPADVPASPAGGEHPEAGAEENLTVSREDWNMVLHRWGLGVAVPLGVPLPDVMPGANRVAVVQDLRDAVERMNGGDYLGSITATRKAVEGLREISPAELPLPKSSKERSGEQRRHALLDALYDLTSAAVHSDGPSRDERWTRRDTLLALATAAALAQRLFGDEG